MCDVAAVAKQEHFAYSRWALAQPPLPTAEEGHWLDEAAKAIERDDVPMIRTAAHSGFVRLAAPCP